ncbi:glycosyltransferase family 2 protein [Bacillus mycoides]|uniref:Glycosyltransferase 2-like domain-containing protein n=1 Tax=Bacillus mycoides TaxID=1405 RepID=A0ABC9RBY0_BACMY|nr:glycosyltransferase family A protein [Bacillus mycoides]EJR45446.1 hypothetical protein III_00284 [Bacillus mycoides]
MIRVTVFTPTYNRAHTLYRVYNSLSKQNVMCFEWIIVDDGSTDNTQEVVRGYMEEAPFKINYYKKENGGKHTALIEGVKYANGELFLIADSDDEFESNTIETFLKYYDGINENEKAFFSGVSCLCKYSDSGNVVGDLYPKSPMISNNIEIEYVHNIQGEKWGILKTDILKKYLLVDLPNVKFISENYFWFQIAEKYKTLYINEALRTYYLNSTDSLSVPFTTERHPLGVFLCEEKLLQTTIRYFRYAPKKILLGAIRMTYAAQRAGIPLKKVIVEKDIILKVLTVSCWPFGSILRKIRGNQYKRIN